MSMKESRSMKSISPSSPRRRTVLVAAAAGTASVLVAPRFGQAAGAEIAPAKASIYPKTAFAQTTEAKALKLMYGKAAEKSASVKLEAPDIAENGAVVPVVVNTNLPKVTSVSILSIDNPFTMAASYKIPPGTNPGISSRIKLAKTTKVVAIVESDGKLYSTSKQVKVTLGGCG